MRPFKQHTILVILGAAPLVSAHGYVSEIFVGSESYIGSNPNWYYQPKGDVVPTAGWFAYNQDNGFVASDAYGSQNISCHKAATPGNQEIPVTAGSTLSLQWNTWPDSHHGPVLDYLAACPGNCTAVTASQLSFFKIDQGGLVNDASPPGSWATDQLISQNFTWHVTIPSDIKPGSYVLRHEIIALHAAQSVDGAQNYPQCVNLLVTGSGSTSPCTAGANCTGGPGLYNENDPGILIDIYEPISSYIIPGPAVWSGFAAKLRRAFRV